MSGLASSGWFTLHGLLSAVGLLVYAIGSHTFHQRRHPSAALAWVMAILLLPEAGVPLYLLFGTRKLPKAQTRRPRAPVPLDDAVVPVWAQKLTASMGLAPPGPCTDLRVHRDGVDAVAALHALIDSAQTRLDVCTFILGRDAVGDEIARRLGERAREGVRVRLIVDGVGELIGGRRDFRTLRAQGVQVASFEPPFRSPLKWPLRGRSNLRNHRKLVVADAQRLWCGGRNLAAEYFDGVGLPWIDLSFDLSGSVALEAAMLFDADWHVAVTPGRGRATLPLPDAPLPPAPFIGPAAQLLPSGPDFADDTVHTLLLSACFQARERILAVTPYLVPDESLLSALMLAARRGVAVDLLLPAHSNHRLADIARGRPMRELAAAGARLWLMPRMIHAKAVVVDDRLALAGSVNLDSRSLFLNYELMTAFYARAQVAAIADWIDSQRRQAAVAGASAPGLMRMLGEGLVLWLAFQL